VRRDLDVPGVDDGADGGEPVVGQELVGRHGGIVAKGLRLLDSTPCPA
jgi:hypothetical protein